MYYEDQYSRFNLFSGLLTGAVLGAGLALLLAPERRGDRGPRLGRGARRAAGRVKVAAARRLEDARDGVEEAARIAQRRLVR